MLQELKDHLIEMRSILDTIVKNHGDESVHFIDPVYYDKICKFMDKFHYWKPEIFIHVERGSIESMYSNCNIHVNLWDDDDEKQYSPDDDGILYNDRKMEWEYMIGSNLNSGVIKKIL